MREVFYESTASDDVLVDRNGDPLNLGLGGGSPSSSYFQLDGNKDYSLAENDDDTFVQVPWVAGQAMEASPANGAPCEAVVWETGQDGPDGNAIQINESGLWLFVMGLEWLNFSNFSSAPADFGSETNWRAHVECWWDLYGGHAWAEASVRQTIYPSYKDDICYGTMTHLSWMPAEGTLSLRFRGRGAHRFLGGSLEPGGNHTGCSLTATKLG